MHWIWQVLGASTRSACHSRERTSCRDQRLNNNRLKVLAKRNRTFGMHSQKLQSCFTTALMEIAFESYLPSPNSAQGYLKLRFMP